MARAAHLARATIVADEPGLFPPGLIFTRFPAMSVIPESGNQREKPKSQSVVMNSPR